MHFEAEQDDSGTHVYVHLQGSQEHFIHFPDIVDASFGKEGGSVGSLTLHLHGLKHVDIFFQYPEDAASLASHSRIAVPSVTQTSVTV